METVLLTKDDVQQVASFLLKHEIVVFPTETVLGISCVADSYPTFTKLLEAKNRPINKAFPVVVGSYEDIRKVANVNIIQLNLIKKFLPGPLTVVLRKSKDYPDFLTAGNNTVAVRMSDDEFTMKLVKAVGKPLLLTSANMSGEPVCQNDEEAMKVFNGRIKCVVKGSSRIGVPSTIVDLTGETPKILREGVITLEQIMKEWGK